MTEFSHNDLFRFAWYNAKSRVFHLPRNVTEDQNGMPVPDPSGFYCGSWVGTDPHRDSHWHWVPRTWAEQVGSLCQLCE